MKKELSPKPVSSVKVEDLPAEPTNQNRFLKRRCSTSPNKKSSATDRRRSDRDRDRRDRDERDRRHNNSTLRITRSGIRVKGRGAIRFHADDYHRDRSRSLTPPHWKREEVCLI